MFYETYNAINHIYFLLLFTWGFNFYCANKSLKIRLMGGRKKFVIIVALKAKF